MINIRLIFRFSLEDSKQFICSSINFQFSKNCFIWWRLDQKWYWKRNSYRNGRVIMTLGTTSTIFCTLQLWMINWIASKIPNTNENIRMIKVNSPRRISEVECSSTEISSRLGWIPLYFIHCHTKWRVPSSESCSGAAPFTLILRFLCIINWK